MQLKSLLLLPLMSWFGAFATFKTSYAVESLESKQASLYLLNTVISQHYLAIMQLPLAKNIDPKLAAKLSAEKPNLWLESSIAVKIANLLNQNLADKDLITSQLLTHEKELAKIEWFKRHPAYKKLMASQKVTIAAINKVIDQYDSELSKIWQSSFRKDFNAISRQNHNLLHTSQPSVHNEHPEVIVDLRTLEFLEQKNYSMALEQLFPISERDQVHRYIYRTIQRLYSIKQQGSGKIAIQSL